VVTQETANAVQGQGLDHVNLLQAAEFAAAATLIPGVAGKVTIGGKQVLQGASGALLSGALTDTAVQGMEGITEGKPFSPGEVVASGILATGGHRLAGAIGSRLQAHKGEGLRSVELLQRPRPSPPVEPPSIRGRVYFLEWEVRLRTKGVRGDFASRLARATAGDVSTLAPL
jgi:hypothetical protein